MKGREQQKQGEESKGREKGQPGRVCGCVKIKRKDKPQKMTKAVEKL